MIKAIEISQEEKLNSLVERVKAIMVESVFSARMTLLEARHKIGQEIVTDELYKKWKKGSGDLVKELEKRIGRGKTEIYLCIKFYIKYPDVSAIVETLPGKKNDITWAAVKRLLVGKSVEECQHQWEKAEYWRCVKCSKKVFKKPDKMR